MKYFAITVKGKKHSENEDRILIGKTIRNEGSCSGELSSPQTVFVFDGVGGETGGATAAETLAEIFSGVQMKTDSMSSVLSRLAETNTQFRKKQEERGADNSATTAAGFIIGENEFLTFNSGDTRIYAANAQRLYQLTRDHTRAQELIDCDRVKDPSKLPERYQCTLTSYIGGPTDAFIPFLRKERYSVNRPEVFLLCSDGVYKHISKENIRTILIGEGSPEQKGAALIRSARENGSEDDMSLVLIEAPKHTERSTGR